MADCNGCSLRNLHVGIHAVQEEFCRSKKSVVMGTCGKSLPAHANDPDAIPAKLLMIWVMSCLAFQTVWRNVLRPAF